MQYLICTKCRIKKLVSKFPKDPRKRNGRSSWCKACHELAVQKVRSEDPGSASRIQASYRKRKKGTNG